jgi:PAS domain S-box-containing protein
VPPLIFPLRPDPGFPYHGVTMAHSDPLGPERPPHFSDDAWGDVLAAMDRTYADLVGHQEQLESQNAELEEMRTFLTAILSSVTDVLIVADRAGRIARVSRSFAEVTGRAEAAALGQPLSDMFEAEERAVVAAMLQTVRDRKRTAAFEAHLVTATGHEPLDISLAPRLNDRGRVDGYVLTGRPMGVLRKAYAELTASHNALKTAQAQLVRNEKLASLGRLLAGVAHELNNPISFVYANAHALERYAGKFEAYFARVQDGASREELITLRKDLRLDRELANLREAINGARDGAERVGREGGLRPGRNRAHRGQLGDAGPQAAGPDGPGGPFARAGDGASGAYTAGGDEPCAELGRCFGRARGRGDPAGAGYRGRAGGADRGRQWAGRASGLAGGGV